MDIWKYISVDPQVCHGKPCFRGTRIMVSTVVEQRLRLASRELRAGRTQSMRELLSDLEDRLDETDPVLAAEIEAARREYLQGRAKPFRLQPLRRRASRVK